MNKSGIILAVLLLLVTANSMYYFFGVAKVSFVQWAVFNACAPSSLAFLLGFAIFLLTGNRIVLHAAILPMFFFGGLGLYLFPWSGYNLIAQVSHVIMFLNVLYTVFITLKTNDYKPATLGLLLGIAVFSVFINYQQTYANTHPEEVQSVLGVSLDNFQKKLNVK